jgi:hypothetical protein
MLTPGFVTHVLNSLPSRRTDSLIEPISAWPIVHRGLQEFAGVGGPIRVLRHIANPLAITFGYDEMQRSETVATREGLEDGGYMLRSLKAGSLRLWPIGADTEIDAPSKRGLNARASPLRRAGRVLRARGECAGLLTNGETLRLLLCDSGGPDSQIVVTLTGRSGWASRPDVPESYRLIAALVSARNMAAIGDLFDAARLHQTAVTKTLRLQARTAIEGFLRCILDRNDNAASRPDPKVLWRQALIVVYRLLFILKLESSGEPGGGFSFAASEIWRRSFSPNQALGPLARRHLDQGHETGRLLEDGLRTLFRICQDGLRHPALSIAPFGGGLFDPAATVLLDGLEWGERAVASLLDQLLWTVPRGRERERVHYGSLDVEELGRVYESLLDLEPDVATAPMIRTRRGRLEAVVPAASLLDAGTGGMEQIPTGQFFLRSGLGRRTGGSYYTPHGFVRHLVSEALAPAVLRAKDTCDPGAILRIKILDPAMGSGHFLVESCRFLADALYEICCRCDAIGTTESSDKIRALPDLDRTLSSYLPRRSRDQSDTGPSRTRALAICRRMVVVHCLYGVDRDPLAVELAKLSLWLESFAEGLPLTFLDHRLIAGDSIAGPFFKDLSKLPVGGAEIDPLLARGVADQLAALVGQAMTEVHHLESSIGTSIADVITKQAAKDRMDRLLLPLRDLARAWSGAVKTSAREANDAWLALAKSVADTGGLPDSSHPHQRALLVSGETALSLDLTFPEVFRRDDGKCGFDAVLGNPPWDVIHYQTKEYLAGFDPRIMEAPTKRERAAIEHKLFDDPAIKEGFRLYKDSFLERKRLCDRLFPKSGSGGSIDLFQTFSERMLDCVADGGAIGIVVPSSFQANEGTTHLRREFLRRTRLESCFTFENRKKLFDIHGRQKFTLIVARRTGTTTAFRCAFYLDSIAQLNDPDRIMIYDRAFIAATGGEHETFLELRGAKDMRVATRLFVGRPDMQNWMAARYVSFGREAHMTDDSHRFTPIARADAGQALPLHEGKTFHQYTDRWKVAPRYTIGLDAMRDKPGWLRASSHYRLAFREISRSTDERTMIAAIIPPGYVFGHKGTCEKTPWKRPDATALTLCAVFNSFVFDWCVRQKIAASVSLFMLNSCPAPSLSEETTRFLAHCALRLSIQHVGYARLWREQLGAVRLSNVDTSEDRDVLRAAIDAVIARVYGLTREDYNQVLSGFSHKSHPSMPERCLAAFDSLMERGSRAFYGLHDPFTNVALPRCPGQPDSESPTASAILIPSIAAERIPPA